MGRVGELVGSVNWSAVAAGVLAAVGVVVVGWLAVRDRGLRAAGRAVRWWEFTPGGVRPSGLDEAATRMAAALAVFDRKGQRPGWVLVRWWDGTAAHVGFGLYGLSEPDKVAGQVAQAVGARPVPLDECPVPFGWQVAVNYRTDLRTTDPESGQLGAVSDWFTAATAGGEPAAVVVNGETLPKWEAKRLRKWLDARLMFRRTSGVGSAAGAGTVFRQKQAGSLWRVRIAAIAEDRDTAVGLAGGIVPNLPAYEHDTQARLVNSRVPFLLWSVAVGVLVLSGWWTVPRPGWVVPAAVAAVGLFLASLVGWPNLALRRYRAALTVGMIPGGRPWPVSFRRAVVYLGMIVVFRLRLNTEVEDPETRRPAPHPHRSDVHTVAPGQIAVVLFPPNPLDTSASVSVGVTERPAPPVFRGVLGAKVGYDPTGLWVRHPDQDRSRGVFTVGDAGSGKALALTTPVPTLDGWRTMGDLRVGDRVFTLDGTVTRVVAVSDVMVGRECWEVRFDGGERVVADVDHQWVVVGSERPVTTRELTVGTRVPVCGRVREPRFGQGGWCESGVVECGSEEEADRVRVAVASSGFQVGVDRSGSGWRVVWGPGNWTVTGVEPVESVPVRCVQVEDPSGVFLVSRSFIPTHNSTLTLSYWISDLVARAWGMGKGDGPQRDGKMTLLWFETKGEGADRAERAARACGYRHVGENGERPGGRLNEYVRFRIGSPFGPQLQILDPGNPQRAALLLTAAMKYAFEPGSIQAQSEEALRTSLRLAFSITPDMAAKMGFRSVPNPLRVALTLIGSDDQARNFLLNHLRDTAEQERNRRMLPPGSPVIPGGPGSPVGTFESGFTETAGPGILERIAGIEEPLTDAIASLERYLLLPRNQRDQVFEPPRNKLTALLVAEHMFQPAPGQPVVPFSTLINQHWAAILDFSRVPESSETVADRLAAIVFYLLWEETKHSCEGWQAQGRSIGVFVDELAMVSGLGAGDDIIGKIPDQGRSRGYQPVFATQRLSQLPERVQDAVLSMGSMFVFVLTKPEQAEQAAGFLTGGTAGSYTSDDIRHLPPYTAVARLRVHGQAQPPFTVHVVDDADFDLNTWPDDYAR